MDIVDRLILYRDYVGLTNSQLADSAGIPRPTLSQFLNGRNKRMSDDMTAKLHVAFPGLNVMWLLFGEGDMVTDSNFKISEGKNDVISDQSATEVSVCKDFEEAAVYGTASSEQYTNGSETSYTSTASGQKAQPQVNAAPAGGLPLSTDPAKKIQSIMVFYSDSSYEIFTPAD